MYVEWHMRSMCYITVLSLLYYNYVTAGKLHLQVELLVMSFYFPGDLFSLSVVGRDLRAVVQDCIR